MGPSTPAPWGRSLPGFLVLTLTAAYYLALASYSPWDPSPYAWGIPPLPVANHLGLWGGYGSGALFYHCGLVAWLLPLPILSRCTLYLLRLPGLSLVLCLAFYPCFVLTCCLGLSAALPHYVSHGFSFDGGGACGRLLFATTGRYLGLWGRDICLVWASLSSLALLMPRSLAMGLRRLQGRFKVQAKRKNRVLAKRGV